MPDKKSPVAYAEDDLGVHEVYEQAQEAHEALAHALDTYAEKARVIRAQHDRIEHREFELASAHKAAEPSLSQEALKRTLKDAHRTDDVLVDARRLLHEAQSEQENAHALIEKNKYRLRVLSARMNELGGLLAFLAAAKSAAAQRRST